MIKRSISFWFSVILSLMAVSYAGAIKPSPPLKLFLDQESVSKEVYRVTLNAIANLDISLVELSMELSPDLSLMEGSTEWEGALKKGEIKKIELRIKNSGNIPRKVTGKAIVHLDAAGEFIETSTITLNEKTG